MTTSLSTPALIKACHIHKLPIELLATIFHEHSFQDWEAPFIDSRVCRRWRETTHLYPELWSRIAISQKYRRPLSRIKASLSRSRENPLFIHFRRPHLTHGEGNSIRDTLFSDEATSRMRELCYEGYLMTLPVDGVWRNLRALHLKPWGYGNTNTNVPFDREHFPSLEELILNGEMPLPINLGVLPPLRYLSLMGVHGSVRELLSGSSDTLVELVVHHCRQPPPSSATIHLPKLRYLAVFDGITYVAEPFTLRSRLVAPNLSVIHEQQDHRVPFNLHFNSASVVEYACQAEFFCLDENVFAERLKLERLALMGPLNGLKKIFRIMASSPHHLSHLSTVELRTQDGSPITDSRWLELRDLLKGTPLHATLKLQPMPRVSSVLWTFFGIFSSILCPILFEDLRRIRLESSPIAPSHVWHMWSPGRIEVIEVCSSYVSQEW